MVLEKMKALNTLKLLHGEKMHNRKPGPNRRKQGSKGHFNDNDPGRAASERADHGGPKNGKRKNSRTGDTRPKDKLPAQEKPQTRTQQNRKRPARDHSDQKPGASGPEPRKYSERREHPGQPEHAQQHATGRGREGDKNYVAGRKPVTELLQTAPGRVDLVNLRKGRVDAKISAIVDLCVENGIRYKFVDPASLDRLFKGTHQGVVAQVAGLEYAELETLVQNGLDAPLPLIIVLDRVQDTGNVGALARTLYALGGAGLVVPQHEGAYIGAGAIKASAGALNLLPVAKVVNIARTVRDLARQGWMTYCADQSEASENVFDPNTRLHLPGVLVLGNEEKGVRPGVAKACDRSLHIPFARRFDSLNVSSAGSALMTLFALQATRQ